MGAMQIKPLYHLRIDGETVVTFKTLKIATAFNDWCDTNIKIDIGEFYGTSLTKEEAGKIVIALRNKMVKAVKEQLNQNYGINKNKTVL